MWRAWLPLIAVLFGGCYEEASLQCGSRICPTSQVCIGNEACVFPEQVAVCDDHDEQSLCSYRDVSGVCRGGVCTTIECGDTIVDPGEVCDDGDTVSGDGCSHDCRSRFATMEVPVAWNLAAAYLVSSREVYAAASTVLLDYDGTTWRSTPLPIEMTPYTMWATAGSILIGGTQAGPAGFVITVTNGIAKERGFGFSVTGIGGRGPTDLYVVGVGDITGGTLDNIVHFDGMSWSSVSIAPCNPNLFMSAVIDSGAETFVAGEAGICRGTSPTSWSQLDTTAVSRLAIRGQTLYALASGMTIHKYSLGADGLHTQLAVPGMIRDFAVLEDDVIIAIGNAGQVLEYQPSSNTWTRIVVPTSVNLFGVVGTTPNDVFIVGDSGTILH